MPSFEQEHFFLLRQSANLNGLEFREICDYEVQDDETIYTGHFLDLY